MLPLGSEIRDQRSVRSELGYDTIRVRVKRGRMGIVTAGAAAAAAAGAAAALTLGHIAATSCYQAHQACLGQVLLPTCYCHYLAQFVVALFVWL